ncbi:hypothetical protein ACSAZK_17480 [Methanosarcina sp. Mfa9]|uniref:hypothetical protein n=1 Tax=Methanosarcina sp. Mfa9 TaxID=3439063 RepID=UPI003F839684
MDNDKNYARASSAFEHWKSLKNKYPYFHPPDLFHIDPCAKSPYLVPQSFIPISIGGNIEIESIDKGRNNNLGSETADFTLVNFLPGGYKKRWNFDHYKAIWKLSTVKSRMADVSSTFNFFKKIPLSELISNKSKLSHLNLPVENSIVYFPSTVYVEKVFGYKYYWDEERYFIEKEKNEGFKLYELSRDPTSFPIQNCFLLNEFSSEQQVRVENSTLLKQIGYSASFHLAKCYCGNCLDLFGKKDTLTRLIRFFHDNDNAYALIGTEHISEAVEFKLSIGDYLEKLKTVLESDKILENDLKFAFLYVNIYDEVLYKGNLLKSTYDIDALYNFILGIDYWIKQENPSADLSEIFTAENKNEVLNIILKLIPESEETRLVLAGYDEKKTFIKDVFQNNFDGVLSIIKNTFDEIKFKDFCESVFCETIVSALNVWTQKYFGINEDNLIFWYDEYVLDGNISIYAYDNYQGGSGISKEFFKKIVQKSSESIFDFQKELLRVLQCEVCIAETILLYLLSEYDVTFIFNTFKGSSPEQDPIILKCIENIEKSEPLNLNKKEKETLITFVKKDLHRLVGSEELTAFYSELSRSYCELKSKIKRSPTSVDMLLYSSEDIFYDPRAMIIYEKYRSVKRGDCFEVFDRVKEIVPSCTNACPECISSGNQYMMNPYGFLQVDKRLLRRLLEMSDAQ